MVSLGLAWLEQESVVTHFIITIIITIILNSVEKEYSYGTLK